MKMQFALVEGERREAEPGLSGKCPLCGDATIAKCGKIKVWHWAHKRLHTCDHWWESESEWHVAWKNRFPKEWHEIVHRAEDGEKHFADVKTKAGVVIEFQRSPLHPKEREARENFYRNMVWVVYGLRRVRDRAQFFASLRAAVIINKNPLIVMFPWNEGALLREWQTSRVPVYFDVGDVSEPDDPLRFNAPVLWRLNPCGPNGVAYLSPVRKAEFLRIYLEGLSFEEMCSEVVERAAARYWMQQAARSGRLTGFSRYMAKKEARRPRF